MIYDKIRAELKHAYYKINPPAFISKLNILEEQLEKILPSIPKTNLNILVGPSFSIYEPCFIHDRILSIVLRLRGANIIPIYCDGIQHKECNVYAGRWIGTSFENACTDCQLYSKLLWSKSFRPKKLSNWLSTEDITSIQKTVTKLGFKEILNYEIDGYPLGQWCQDIIVNSYMVGDFKLIENYELIFKTHLENLLRLKKSYEGMLTEIKPDRIVSNDSFYGMWAILEYYSKNHNLAFYSQWEGDRKNAWCYAYQDAAMKLDFSKPWQNFSSQPLSPSAHLKVDDWLSNRLQGQDMILNTAAIGTHHTDEFPISVLDNGKPKALLCANVVWDCAALNKQIVFNDMMDWILQTIKWFEENPQYELIIKPHPVEENPLLPKTVETVRAGLLERNVKLPSNVYLLSAKVKLTVYDLFNYVQVGLVHTSTVGMEMAAKGKFVITSAKAPYQGYGFTLDAQDKAQYFQLISDVLTHKMEVQNTQVEKAYQFISFYRFHYYTKIDIMSYEFSKEPTVMIEDIEALMPGNHYIFDYIADRIMAGESIISENYWMPET